jgi:hypothetical protein
MSGQSWTEYLFEIPRGAGYNGYSIERILFTGKTNELLVGYEGDDLEHGWDELRFPATRFDTGTVHITDYPQEMVVPVEARKENSKEAIESKFLYDTLEEVGIRVYP